jgi:hypothetical protein
MVHLATFVRVLYSSMWQAEISTNMFTFIKVGSHLRQDRCIWSILRNVNIRVVLSGGVKHVRGV